MLLLWATVMYLVAIVSGLIGLGMARRRGKSFRTVFAVAIAMTFLLLIAAGFHAVH